MQKRTTLAIKTQFAGFHHWPDAPVEVSFLRNLHRHVFHVEAKVIVRGHDRELEYFLLQKELNKACSKLLVENQKRQQTMSCEHMADFLLDFLRNEPSEDFPSLPVVAVTVGEDGENSATVELVETPPTRKGLSQ